VRRGRWQESNQFCYFDYPIYDIAGSTLGIIGYGALGKSIATRAEALGMKLLINDVVPGPGIVDIPTILREADVVTLNLPLTPQTKNLIGAKELASMKKTSIIINTARGGIVDEQALADALRNGVIAGAGFDVLTVEPPKQGNILLDPTIPNLIVTPHVAWASKEAMQVLADQLVDNIDAFVAGAPRNLVTA
jgi:glycerate dehydrogenase